jgi:hypothetical protein
MHDQGSPTPADGPESVEQAVLSMLVAHGGVWSDDEVAREMGDPVAATDALANLYGAGLVHRLSGFVFATRPAVRAVELA